ncbi:hypothetical protein Pla110_24320 [Polystyrenella longa]|uniref:Uncharacterized protein n=1 Tax=Polystyrenella longa TaxID=2528007 RepID=A0A518CN97_9PLAN|nr:hypothetical protein Pla110_24320 [Polystyrenella longa]
MKSNQTCPQCRTGKPEPITGEMYRCDNQQCKRLLRWDGGQFTDYLNWQTAGRKKGKRDARFKRWFKRTPSKASGQQAKQDDTEKAVRRSTKIQTGTDMTKEPGRTTGRDTAHSVGSDEVATGRLRTE